MLIRILVTGIHADKISVARKKKNTRASLSEETVVISVRENELILQRAQKGNPEALNLLFEHAAASGLRPPFVFFPWDRTLWGSRSFTTLLNGSRPK
jgi:hypothetical protein